MAKALPLFGLTLLTAALAGCQKPEATSARPDPAPVVAGVGWRGDGTGKFPHANPPLHWSKEQNVAWHTPLPAPSNASPIVANDRVFVCAEPDTLLCLDAKDGRILWEKKNGYLDILPPDEAAKARAAIEAAEATRLELQKAELTERRLRTALKATADDAESRKRLEDTEVKITQLKQRMGPALTFRLPQTQVGMNGYSTPTPATDGKRVFVLFGTGVAACYDLEGNRLWARVVEQPTDEYGHSSSPLLAGGKLLILINSLHALDAATGETTWKATAKHAWGSPVLTTIGNEAMVVCPGGEVIRWRDGKVLTTKGASLGHCSPVADGGVLYAIEALAHAVRFEAPKRPDRLKRTSVWNVVLAGDRYYASPLVHAGVIFAVGQHGEFTTIDAANGRIIQQHKLEVPAKVTFYSSPVLAGGHVFVSADDGTTFVFTAEREAKLVAKNLLEPTRSTLCCERSRLFVRTTKAVWCIDSVPR